MCPLHVVLRLERRSDHIYGHILAEEQTVLKGLKTLQQHC